MSNLVKRLHNIMHTQLPSSEKQEIEKMLVEVEGNLKLAEDTLEKVIKASASSLVQDWADSIECCEETLEQLRKNR